MSSKDENPELDNVFLSDADAKQKLDKEDADYKSQLDDKTTADTKEEPKEDPKEDPKEEAKEEPKAEPKKEKPKIIVQSGLEFIDILAGRISTKNMDKLKVSEPIQYTDKDGKEVQIKLGTSFPRIDTQYWEGKSKSFGFANMKKKFTVQGDQEFATMTKNPKFTDPADAIQFIKEQSKKGLGTKVNTEDIEKQIKDSCENLASAFMINKKLFDNTITGKNDLNSTEFGPMFVENVVDEYDYSEGKTSVESTDTSQTKHEIWDAYCHMNNTPGPKDATLDDTFNMAIGGLRKECQAIYNDIPDTEQLNPDVVKLKESIDTLRTIETNGQSSDTLLPPDEAENNYNEALNQFLNHNMPAGKYKDASNPLNKDALNWYKDLFIFAWRKYREYENEWIKTATASHEGIGQKSSIYKQFGGNDSDDSDDESETDGRNNGVVYHYNDTGGIPVGVRNLPARPNPLIVIGAIMAQVYFLYQLYNITNRIGNAFTGFHERIIEFQYQTGQGEMFEGPDSETCYAGFSFAIIWEFIRSYFWSGFDMTMSGLEGVARERLWSGAQVVTNAASAAASDTWTWGSLSWLANAASGTSSQYAIQIGRNQANHEVMRIFQESLLNFNNWQTSFDYTIRATSTALVLGMNGFAMSSVLLLNQINPRLVNSWTVRASIGAFVTQFSTAAGVVPLLAMTPFMAQNGILLRGVRNYMLGRVDMFGYDPRVNTDEPIIPETVSSRIMDLTRHYTGTGTDELAEPDESGQGGLLQISAGDDRTDETVIKTTRDRVMDLIGSLSPIPIPATEEPSGIDALLAASEGISDGETSD